MMRLRDILCALMATLSTAVFTGPSRHLQTETPTPIMQPASSPLETSAESVPLPAPAPVSIPMPVPVSFVPARNRTFPILDPDSLSDLYAKESNFGIWFWPAYRPSRATKAVYPGLKGGLIIYRWSQLEPLQGMYDWTEVDDYMDAAIAEGLKFGFALQVGPDSPEWLYEQGVPKVLTTETNFQFPYYFDPLYLESFDLVNQEAIDHLRNLSAQRAKSLVEVTLNDGSTGDPYCYKGDLLPGSEQFDISRKEWDEFRRENIQSLYNHLGTEGLETLEMAFAVLSEATEAFVKNLFNSDVMYFKNGMASHGYHIPDDEASTINVQRSLAFDGDPALLGTRVRWFGEMDREWLNGWFQRSPKESFWWSAIYALHMGMSRWHVRDDALENPEYHFAFDFFSKHGEHIDAATSPYSFCALRDGLDASDTNRFGDERYGTSANKTDRLLKILDDFAPYGAVVEDLSVTGASSIRFRQRTGYVDVLYGGVRGNYHRFLYQIDPPAESIGWWHVGSNDWPYGRFARSFQSSTGRNAMYFRLDDRFISDKKKAHKVKVSVTYFDEGNGTWKLLFRDPVIGVRSAVSVTCDNTARWKKVQVEFIAVFNNGLGNGADLVLRHVGGSDTKFHMIELDRVFLG